MIVFIKIFFKEKDFIEECLYTVKVILVKLLVCIVENPGGNQ